jgi:hypothetical protein
MGLWVRKTVGEDSRQWGSTRKQIRSQFEVEGNGAEGIGMSIGASELEKTYGRGSKLVTLSQTPTSRYQTPSLASPMVPDHQMLR